MQTVSPGFCELISVRTDCKDVADDSDAWSQCKAGSSFLVIAGRELDINAMLHSSSTVAT